MTGPVGHFTRDPATAGPSLLVAAGAGFAPFRAMVLDAVRAGATAPMWLLLGARSEADVAYRAELDALCAKHPWLRVEVTLSRPGPDWRGRRGYVQGHVPELWGELVGTWPGARVYRYRGRLFAVAGQVAPSFREGTWTIGTSFDLGSLGRLDLRPSTGLGLSRERLPSALRVVRRPQGARFRPSGGAHHRPLRKWLQERGVLPWQREALPLLEADGEIVAIGDLAYGGALAAAPDEPSWVVDWTGRPVLTEPEAVAGGGPFR